MTLLETKLARINEDARQLVEFGGVALVLDPAGAIYALEEETLIISDLHLGKGDALARRGARPLPDYDTVDTIARISELIQAYAPKRLVALGDSFHDVRASLRLPPNLVLRLNQLIDKTQWIWVLGNHDPAIHHTLEGARCEDYQLGNLLLTHEPEALATYQVIGHFHPKLRRQLGRHHISGRCFVMNEACLIMPSFGSYTGGLYTSHEAIQAVLGSAPARHYLIYGGKVWQIKDYT